MSSPLPQPVPKDLREQMIDFIRKAPEDELPEINRRLLIAERDKLWREVQEQATKDAESGKFGGVQERIEEYRARVKDA